MRLLSSNNLFNVILRPLTKTARIWICSFIVGSAAFVWFFNHYKLSINLSHSLPGKLYLVERGVLPHKGDYAEFSFEGEAYYTKGTHFLKQVVGVAGSVVTTNRLPDGRTQFKVDGVPAGIAKMRGRDGRPLSASKPRVIAPGAYYMAATHPDSFDSRYELFGDVTSDQIIGRAIKIF